MAASKSINMEVGRELRAAFIYHAYLKDRDVSKEGRRMIRKILKEEGYYTGELDPTGKIDPDFLRDALKYLEEKEKEVEERRKAKQKNRLNHA